MSRVPYAEPNWMNPVFDVPHYGDSHRKLRKDMRVLVDTLLRPEALEREVSGEYPSKEMYRIMADNKINHMRLGPGKHLHGLTLLGGLRGEDYNQFQ